MNHIYRLVWNRARGAWLVVCELTHTGQKSSASPARKARRAGIAAIGISSILASAAWADPAANALPNGAQIAAGQVAISQSGNQLKIQQASTKAIINWRSFDIGKSAEVLFAQPDATSVALNRVSSATASQIYGKLTANGQVFLLNQNGVLFGQGAQVDVGGIVAGAMKITDKDFLDGNYHFTDGKGVVTNRGTISASDGGMIALLAPEVRNEGVIRAHLGTVVLAAGDAITLTNSQSGLTVVIDKGAMKALVDNRQLVWAEDGRVFMSAMAASALQAAVINNSGTIEAQNAVRQGSTIRLTADTITNSGSISVAGRTETSQGGTISLAANDIAVNDGAMLDASGPMGGGSILVGGGWQGSGAMHQATHVRIEQGVTLDASAKIKGDGGTIVAWSDVHNTDSTTTVLGTVRATGGILSGNGGQIETSGHQVNTDTIRLDASAARGIGGLWLIDPYDYTINATAAGNIVSALNGGTSVTVSTQTSNASYGGGASSNGDITVSSAISKTLGGAATLTLQADRNIIINAAIGSTSGTLGIVLSADNAGSASLGGVNVGASLTSNGGTILIGGASGTSTHGIAYARNLTASTPAVQIGTNVAISSGGGSITINGKTTATTGSYSAAGGGVYVQSGASINTGGGNLYISGVSTGDAKEFGFGVEGNANTLTTFTTSVGSGNIFIDAQNTLNANGALGLVNSGNQARVQFSAPSVAAILISINGSPQASTFTIVPPCGSSYPNCGTLLVPGSNNSYLYASYQAVSMATHALYVNTSSGSKTYDATTSISGLTYTTTGAPGDFTTSSLSFTTPSKNAATYYTLVDGGSNPTSFHSTTTGFDYAVAYFYGNYTINTKTITISATNKIYDGTTAAALTSSGAIGGDSLTFSATGGFSDANYGLGKTVNVTGITLSGTDAANYSLSGTTLTTTADITKRAVNLTANRSYDTTTSITAGTITLGNLVSGEALTLTGTGSVTDKTAANGKSLSLGTLALGNGTGGLSSNYTLTGGTDIANITPVVLSVSGLTAQNKVYDGTTTATLSGTASLSGVLSSDSVTISGTSGTFSDKNVGTGKTVTFAGLTLGGTDAVNYTLSGASGTATANITAASLAITTVAIVKTYDGGLSAAGTATVSSGTLFSGDTLSGGTFAFTDKNAGTGNKTVTVTGVTVNDSNSGSNYNVTYVSNTASTINKATISGITGITAADKIYDATRSATLDTSGAGFTGKIGGDVLTVTGVSGLFSDKNYGTGKTVDISGLTLGGTDAGNYTLASATATTTASIAKASLTISSVTASNRSYDGTTTATLNSASASVVPLSSDVVTLVTSGATGAFGNKNVGTGKAITVTGFNITGTDSGNYNLVQPTGLLADITAALLSITTSNVTKTYDGGVSAAGTAAVSSGTLFSSDTLSGGTFAFTNKNAGTSNKTVTVTGVTVNDGNSGNNYTVSYVSNTTSTIARAAIAAISGITAANKVYDGGVSATLDTSGASFSGKIGSDVLTVSSASGSFANKNAANGKTVSITGLVLGGTDAGNYTLSTTTASTIADITKATINAITGITASNKVYDGSVSATLDSTGASFTGKIGSDILTVSSASGSFADKNAANGKTVSITGLTLGGTDAGNYILASTTGSASADITKATINAITGITASNKVYDTGVSATLDTANASFTGKIGSDVLTVSSASGSFANKNAADGKTVSITGLVLGGTDAGNYTLSTTTASTIANITRAALSVSGLTIQNKVYDGTDAAQFSGTPSLDGVLGSDNVGFSGSVAAHFADKNAGNGKTVTITGLTLAGTDAGNYTLSTTTAATTADITKAIITAITGFAAANKVYDGTTATTLDTTGTSFTGKIAGDTLSIGSANAAFADKNAGNGKTVTITGLTLGGADAGNYTLASTTGTASADITKAVIAAITGFAAANKVYDGTTAATLDTTGASFTGKIAGDTLSIGSANAAFANKNAGNGKTVSITGLTLGGADASNYTLASTTGTASADITKAIITAITGISAATKTYDGSTAATLNTTNASFSGLIAGDTLVLASANGAFADKNAGSGKAVTISGLTLSGADAANYDFGFTTTSTTGTILPKTLTVGGATVADKTFDGTTTATINGAAVNGLISGDQVALNNAATGIFATTGPGNTIAVTTAMTLSGNDAANYSLIQPSDLTGTINAVVSEPRPPETIAPVTTPVTPTVTAAVPSTTGALVVPAEVTAPVIATAQPASVTTTPQQVALTSSSTTTVTPATGGTAVTAGVTQGFTSVRNFEPVTVSSGSAFSFVLPADTFTHSDSKANIAVTASTATGGALPDWLTFSGSDHRFTGTAPKGVSQLKVTVTARDQLGNQVSATLVLSFGQSQQV